MANAKNIKQNNIYLIYKYFIKNKNIHQRSTKRLGQRHHLERAASAFKLSYMLTVIATPLVIRVLSFPLAPA